MQVVRTLLAEKMSIAERKAWEALSGYKFWMFGYHAAQWVNMNSLFPHSERFANPFRDAVNLAKNKSVISNESREKTGEFLL